MRKRGVQKVQSKIGQYINDNPNAQLRDLLDQEELLESKQNSKLFGEFVTKTPERFWEMLQIINLIPKQNEEVIPNKYNVIVIFRYPFLVSEIFGNKEEQIINYFFDQQGREEFEFLNMLFKTIDRDCIDITLAGYVAKILKAIIEKRGLSLWKYLTNQQKESQYVLKDLIKLLDVHHIAEIIYNLIRLDVIREEGEEEVYINQRLELLSRIINFLQQKSYNGVIVENISYILQNILTETTDDDERSQFINTILSSSLKYDSIYISKSSSLVKILIIMLEYIQRDIQTGENKIFNNYSLFQEVGNNLIDLLNLDQNLIPFSTSYGVKQEPLGQFKLQLIEFYLKVVKMNDPQIIPYFYHQHVCFTMMSLIIKHEFNNAIQNLFLELIEIIMKNDAYLEIQQAYKSANLMDFFIYLNSQEKYQVGSIKKYITKGFQGMVNKLSFILKGDFQDESWSAYLQNHQQIFQNENTFLLGQNPNYNENQEQEEALMKSIQFTTDTTSVKQTQEEVDSNKNQNQQQQQQIIQQQTPSIQQQESAQLKIIIPFQEKEVQEPKTEPIGSQDNVQQISNQKFGEIDKIYQIQEEIQNQNDQINKSIQLEDEPIPFFAEMQQAIKSTESKDPDYPDKILVNHSKMKEKSEKNSKSGELEIERKIETRSRSGTVQVTQSNHVPKPNFQKRKSLGQSPQKIEIPDKLSTHKAQPQSQIFSPKLQFQIGDKNK